MSSPVEHHQPAAEEGASRARLVLIVEDEAIIAMSLEDRFSDDGFLVAGPFPSCAGALASLDQAVPDLAILDAMLRDGPCLELARELRARGVPFLIYSGAEAFEEHAAELDGVPWIEKPSPVDTVVSAARRLL